jgi:hypothetical protein
VVVVDSGVVVVVLRGAVVVVTEPFSLSLSFGLSPSSTSAVVAVVAVLDEATAGAASAGGAGAVVVVVEVGATSGWAIAITASTFSAASFFSWPGTFRRSVCSRRAVASAFGLSLASTASFNSSMCWFVSSRAGESTGRPTV